LENVLLETMFELPSQTNISEVIINKDVIDGKTKPLLIYAKKTAQGSSLASKDLKTG